MLIKEIHMEAISPDGFGVTYIFIPTEDESPGEATQVLLNRLATAGFKPTRPQTGQPTPLQATTSLPTTTPEPPRPEAVPLSITNAEQKNMTVDDQDPLIYVARDMSCQMRSGNPLWRITGADKFTEYGINIFPEILREHNIDPDSLEPTKIYDMSRYVVTYSDTARDDGKRNRKVTNLIHENA